MGTVVYQGLHESQMVERALRFRLSSPWSHCSSFLEFPLKPRTLDSSFTKVFEDPKCQYEEITQKTNFVQKASNYTGPASGGWSFLQALDDGSDNCKEPARQTTYVHPLTKSSSSRLSQKSLELCTESLGSETGTDIIEDGVFSSLSETNPVTPSDEGNSPTREQKMEKPSQSFEGKASSRSFPPPLTTMSGAKSIQVRPHRREGRLIIEAVETPSTHTYFHAERSHGRLRLTFVKHSASVFDSASVTSIEDKYEQEENENDVANYDDDPEEEEEKEEEEAAEEEEPGEEEDEEMEMEEMKRRSRCKEGELESHNGLVISSWKSLCVATS